MGLCSDLRVCQPLISEEIAELARNLTFQLEANEELIGQIEAIKSCLINNFDVIKFLFDFYRARDKLLVKVTKNHQYKDDLKTDLNSFLKRCEKNIQIQQKRESIAKEQDQQQKQMSRNVSVLETSIQNQSTVLDNSSNNSAETMKNEVQKEVIPEIVPEETPAQLFSNNCEKFFGEIQHLPQGDSERGNELLQAFLYGLDSQQCLSADSLHALFKDIACNFNLNAVFNDNEQYFRCILEQYGKESDSFQLQNQFDITQKYYSSKQDFSQLQFILVLLQGYQIFNVENPVLFFQNLLVNFAKQLIQQLTLIIKDDDELLQTFFTSESSINVFRQFGEKDDIADMQSITKSSLKSKQLSSRLMATGQSTIPRVLVRDSSYNLQENEQAMIRCYYLENKVHEVFLKNKKNQNGLIYFKQINQEIENIITEGLSGEVENFFYKSKMTVLQFLEKYFDKHNQIFCLPKYSENSQVYINALIPFLAQFSHIDVFQVMDEIYQEKQQNTQVQKEEDQFTKKGSQQPIFDEDFPIGIFVRSLQNVRISCKKFVALITCIIIKQASKLFQKKDNKQAEADEEARQNDNSELINSIRSDNSLYSKYEQNYQQKEMEQKYQQMQSLCQLQNINIDNEAVLKAVTDFLSCIQEE